MNCAHEVRVKGGTPERTVCAGCGKLLAGGFAVFSDGSAGAARGALEAAAEIGLTIGGWTAADVPAPYAERLRRTLAPRMAARLNVQDSDGTLIVSFAPTLAAGTPAAYADEAAEHQRRPALHIVLPDGGRSSIPEDVRKGVIAWVVEEQIATLHVTGPRESDEPGIQQAVHDALVWIFEDEVHPRGKFAGVDRAAAPEPMRLPDAELVRIAVEMAEAGGRPDRVAINPEHVDAAIAAGLDVQVVLPGGDVCAIPASTTAPREPPRIDDYVFTNPPPPPVPADGTFTITREEHYRRLRMELPPIGDPDEA